ncbi:hypothetical protein C6575_31155, partial [Nocardia seriolae]
PDPTHQRIQLGHNTIQHHTTDLPAPTHIGVVAVLGDALPVSGAGKILKRELRKQHWGEGDRQVN